MVVANAAFTVIAATPSIPTPLGQVRVARDVVNDDMQDNARTSHEDGRRLLVTRQGFREDIR
jgi:hypothetical protein